MDFVKKHKVLLIVVGIILILLIIAFIFIKQFMAESSKDAYGNRLDNIDKVEISKETEDNLKKDLEQIESISKVEYRLQGKLINIMMTIKEGTSLEEAKENANKVLEYFDDEQKSYYDIQVFLTNELEESEGYPTIGYKHKTSDALIWKQ